MHASSVLWKPATEQKLHEKEMEFKKETQTQDTI